MARTKVFVDGQEGTTGLRIHEVLVDSLNLSVIDRVSEEKFSREVRELAEELTNKSSGLTPEQRHRTA